MKKSIASLESLAKQIYLEKRKHYTFTGEASYTREEAYICWIVKPNLVTMTMLYLITVTLPKSSWGGRITNATSIE